MPDLTTPPSSERRLSSDRRDMVGRRLLPDRRAHERRLSILPVVQHRRVGGERRSGRDRRSGLDRRKGERRRAMSGSFR